MQKENKHTFTNHLINETSPYLLQHAHNPVDWYPWSQEALDKARKEDKPILLSIGYAACHWCHVMERESFEDTAIAKFMNEHFICIKVDREERPDIDQIYMDAVQMMTGSGGWPLNVFLTPDGKPFYGGTYFPPEPRFGRPSWRQVLESVVKAFNENRQAIEQQADEIMSHLKNMDHALINRNAVQVSSDGSWRSAEDADKVFESLAKRFDRKDGGFGNAPKFPNTMNLQYCLRYYHFKGNSAALDHVILSVDKMIRGGIYDHIGGGFARYATDKKWLIPHFEKMLYDNALLITLLAEVYKIVPDERYLQAIEQTVNFIQREMTSPEGGFYSSLDADSEGEEGKFYVWTWDEIESLLGNDAEIYCKYYGITRQGNWENGKNILYKPYTLDEFIQIENLNREKFLQTLKRGNEILFQARQKRVPPALDDKIILGWNALMDYALLMAYEATGNEDYRQSAFKNLSFIMEKFRVDEAYRLLHTYKAGQAKYPAMLDDYAFLIDVLLLAYENSFDEQWLYHASHFIQTVYDDFYDDETGMFYYTSVNQTDVPVRKTEYYDGATPSGNSTMAMNLLKAAIFFDKPEYHETAEKMLRAIKPSIIDYSTSFGRWANALLYIIYPPAEIAIIGEDYKNEAQKVRHLFIPNRILMGAVTGEQSAWPLLEGKAPIKGKTLFFLCRNYACRLPVDNFNEFRNQLKNF